MKIKNAFQIFFKNYSLVLKVMVTQLVMLAIFIGVGSIFIADMVVDVESGLAEFGVIDNLNAIFQAIAQNNFTTESFHEMMDALRSSFYQWASSVDFFYQKLTVSGLLAFVVVLIVKYFLDFYKVAFNQNLNDFMSTSAKTPFMWRFFKSFGTAAKTQLIYTFFPFLLDVFIVLGSIGIYISMLSISGLIGLVLTTLIMIVLLTLRKTLFAFWIPAMIINEMPPKASMAEGFKGISDCFGKVFGKLLLTTLFTCALVLVFLLGIVHWVTVVVALIIFLNNELFASTICMVEYYKHSNFGFYIDKMKAVDNED